MGKQRRSPTCCGRRRPASTSARSTRARTPGFSGAKADAEKLQPELAERIATLQEQLYAEGRSGGERSVLIVLQGMDTSGKGGTVKHVVGQVDPAGVRVVAFRSPTAEERRHDFLWRIRKELPEPGMLAVFDRSHYEDVVAVRVREHRRPPHLVAPLRDDQPVRGAARRPGHADRQVLLAHLPRRAARAASGAAGRPYQALEVPPRRTSRTAPCGATSSARTTTRSSAAAPTRRPGTSSRPTASGTATGRSAGC